MSGIRNAWNATLNRRVLPKHGISSSSKKAFITSGEHACYTSHQTHCFTRDTHIVTSIVSIQLHSLSRTFSGSFTRSFIMLWNSARSVAPSDDPSVWNACTSTAE